MGAHKVQNFPTSVLKHNDWASLAAKMAEAPSIVFNLASPSLTPGRRLEFILANVETWSKPFCYKFGYSAIPASRWLRYGEEAIGWRTMVIVHVTLSSLEAGWLEAALISHHREKPGNKNIRAGGDSIHEQDDVRNPYANSVYFTYCVFKSLKQPAELRIRSSGRPDLVKVNAQKRKGTSHDPSSNCHQRRSRFIFTPSQNQLIRIR